MKYYKLSEIKAICDQNSIYDENGKSYCDVKRCPYAKCSLDMNFQPTDWYTCTVGFPYLKNELKELRGEK